MSERERVAEINLLNKKEEKSSGLGKSDFEIPSGSFSDRVMFLQRTIGNKAVERLIRSGTLQAKLRIGQPGDEYEQEADWVADQVMRMSEPDLIGSVTTTIQRKCKLCENDEEKKEPTSHIVMQGVEEQEEEYPPVSQAVIFRKAEFAPQQGFVEIESGIADRLIGGQEGGDPLPFVTRHRMEKSLGYDFSHVRVHRDAEAGMISRQLNALAFTHGSHIYFGPGMYDPGRSQGMHLLAHELVHVVQQGYAASQLRNGASAVTSGAHSSSIQRFATWSAGGVHQVNNLAGSILNGTPVGVTWPMLNGSTFWSTADARRLLDKPVLTFQSSASGGVNASIFSAPLNMGSFDETVLAAGPWTLNVPKTTVGARFPTLATCTGPGNSDFRAIGMPTDAAMFAANRRHEDHHAADHRSAFNYSIVQWDNLLTSALAAGTSFNGPTEAAAIAALYGAMGGTPDEVADAFMNACSAAVNAYHATPAGGAVTANNPAANADCSSSSVESTNPS